MRLQAFLYILLRDAVVAGEVERIAREAEKVGPENATVFSNLSLAEYAEELAERLRA